MSVLSFVNSYSHSTKAPLSVSLINSVSDANLYSVIAFQPWSKMVKTSSMYSDTDIPLFSINAWSYSSGDIPLAAISLLISCCIAGLSRLLKATESKDVMYEPLVVNSIVTDILLLVPKSYPISANAGAKS